MIRIPGPASLCVTSHVQAGRAPGWKVSSGRLLARRAALNGQKDIINNSRGHPSRLRSLVRQIWEANQPLIASIGLKRHLCPRLVVPQVLRHSSLHLHSSLIACNMCSGLQGSVKAGHGSGTLKKTPSIKWQGRLHNSFVLSGPFTV